MKRPRRGSFQRVFWLWWVLLGLSLLAGWGASALTVEGVAPVPPWSVGLAVALIGGFYPAWRLWRIRQGRAHPRDWLRWKVLPEGDDRRVEVRAEGLRTPLVMHGVPGDLVWLAREVLAELVAKVGKAPAHGSFQGELVRPGQDWPQRCNLVLDGPFLVVRDPEAKDARAFPWRLMLMHMILMAQDMFAQPAAEVLLREAIPLADAHAPGGADPPHLGFLARKALGDNLVDRGQVAAGLEALGEAVRCSPGDAHAFAAQVISTQTTSTDPRLDFWRRLARP